jgi:hypothetical protein
MSETQLTLEPVYSILAAAGFPEGCRHPPHLPKAHQPAPGRWSHETWGNQDRHFLEQTPYKVGIIKARLKRMSGPPKIHSPHANEEGCDYCGSWRSTWNHLSAWRAKQITSIQISKCRGALSTCFSAIVFAVEMIVKVETKRQVMAPFVTMGNNKRAITNLALSSNMENYVLSWLQMNTLINNLLLSDAGCCWFQRLFL